MAEDNTIPEEEEDDREERLYEAMQTAKWFLKRRIYTAHDLKAKLVQEIPADLLDDVMAECERKRYINDGLSAQYYFEELKRKCYGPRYIRATMKKHGLSAEVIEQTFVKYKEQYDEMQIADYAIRRKRLEFERETDLKKRREKMQRYLYSRGFCKDIIVETIKYYEEQFARAVYRRPPRPF